ncbi:MAG TPA: TRAM domain-containing protein [Microbacteriaceae bacterium]|nr:TRAM domain-containing protein [Microbacteriaceae bacterium]
MELEPELELDVTGIAHGGVGVARDADGRVVFVADAIPGERVRAQVTESKKTFARATATKVLLASPDRVPHVWPEASIDRAPDDRVGGAEFGHIALPRQRALKAEVLLDAMRRFGGVDLESRFPGLDPSTLVAAVPGDDAVGGLGWRTRVRLRVGPDGRAGQYAVRSHRVIPVATLPLAVPVISGVLEQEFAGIDKVDAIAHGGELRLVIGEQKPTVIEERVGARTFRVDDQGFWQVHRAAPEVLVAAVRDAIDLERFDPSAANVDLYGGVGLLASALGDLGGPATRIETVESDARASAHAAENLAEFENAVATVARVDRWVREAAGPSSRSARSGTGAGTEYAGATIVLDPPRSGAGNEVTAAIAGLGAAQLIYVACDPVALARDTKTLEASGYRLTRLTAFDLFPHTHHLEAIATFVQA